MERQSPQEAESADAFWQRLSDIRRLRRRLRVTFLIWWGLFLVVLILPSLPGSNGPGPSPLGFIVFIVVVLGTCIPIARDLSMRYCPRCNGKFYGSSWPPALVYVVLPFARRCFQCSLPLDFDRVHAGDPPFCERCGYNFGGIEFERCPTCGTAVWRPAGGGVQTDMGTGSSGRDASSAG